MVAWTWITRRGNPNFFPPIPDLLFYWLITSVKPKTVGFALGATQGFVVFMQLMICYQALFDEPPGRRQLLSLVTATSGARARVTGAAYGYIPAKMVTTGVVLFWNYFVNRNWTYRDVGH